LICDDHQLMLMSAPITPRPLLISVPWFCGTLIVTAGSTFGCRIR
jgi:hypothetical protein